MIKDCCKFERNRTIRGWITCIREAQIYLF